MKKRLILVGIIIVFMALAVSGVNADENAVDYEFVWKMNERFLENYKGDGVQAWAQRLGYGTGCYGEAQFTWYGYTNSDGCILMYLSMPLDPADFADIEGKDDFGARWEFGFTETDPSYGWIAISLVWIDAPELLPYIVAGLLLRLEDAKGFYELKVEKLYPYVT